MRPLILALALAGCAAPASSQGSAGQGGSTGHVPAVVINFIGDVTVTQAPTAAPAASSTATASQTASNDVKADATVPVDVVPVLGGAKKAPAPAPEPEKKPGE